MLFAKFCLKENRKIGHGEFLFLNGSDYSYRGPHQYWETHLNSTFKCQCLGPEFVFPTEADKSQAVDILIVPYDLLSFYGPAALSPEVYFNFLLQDKPGLELPHEQG